MNISRTRSDTILSVCGEGFRAARNGRPYINLDNAATTPAAIEVWKAVQATIEIYGSVHRGSGLKSVISTELHERAKERIMRFVGAGSGDAMAVASNSTTGINRFANSYHFKPTDIVLISEMEHSSNDLPWRRHATVMRVASLKSGAMDLNDLENVLKKNGRNVRLVSVTAASNVNGFLTSIREVARIAHRRGAEIFVDAAQLAAHRQIRMRAGKKEEELDYVAFSGHKMYAPFGVGIVIGHKHAFDRCPPDVPGGGTIEMLTADDQIWSPSLPNRLSPGSPNLVGLVAVAAAAELIESIGFNRIRQHEARLVHAGLEALRAVPEVELHGQSMFSEGDDRLPVFPFTVCGIPFGKVAAILGHEYGIAVRQGHLCQYEFMRRELGVTQKEQRRIEADLRRGDRSSRYGMVRASCGLCTSEADLAALGEALHAIVRGKVALKYEQDRSTGEYMPTKKSPLAEGNLPAALRFLFDTNSQTRIERKHHEQNNSRAFGRNGAVHRRRVQAVSAARAQRNERRRA